MRTLRSLLLATIGAAALVLPATGQGPGEPPPTAQSGRAPVAQNARGTFGEAQLERQIGPLLQGVAEKAHGMRRFRDGQAELARYRERLERAGDKIPAERRERLQRIITLREELMNLELQDAVAMLRSDKQEHLGAIRQAREVLGQQMAALDRPAPFMQGALQRLEAAEKLLAELPDDDAEAARRLLQFSEELEGPGPEDWRGRMGRRGPDGPPMGRAGEASDQRLERLAREVEALQMRQQALMDELGRLRGEGPMDGGGEAAPPPPGAAPLPPLP